MSVTAVSSSKKIIIFNENSNITVEWLQKSPQKNYSDKQQSEKLQLFAQFACFSARFRRYFEISGRL